MKKRHLFFAVITKLSLCLILAGIICLVYFSYLFINPKSSLREKFFGHEAEYKGIITLWNIDTFEGGCSSRSGFLQSVAAQFEKKNKGALLKIENLTIDEAKANIDLEVYPQILCFGRGGALLKDRFIELDLNGEKIIPNFYSSGCYNGKFIACPYAYGGYFLFTNTKRIEDAGKSAPFTKELALSLAYDKKLKKSTKHIFSLTFGRNDFVDATRVFTREFDESAFSLKDSLVLDSKYDCQSPYDAYCSFISGNASCLIGTQRDYYRLDSRVMAGKEEDLIGIPLNSYTDLVCYISVLEGETKIKSVCHNFVKFLLSDEIQSSLSKIGLFSPTNLKLYDTSLMMEYEKNVDMVVESAF